MKKLKQMWGLKLLTVKNGLQCLLVTYLDSAGVWSSEEKGIFLWLMVCLLKAFGFLPLPMDGSVFPGLDWSGLMLSGFPLPQALSTQSLPTEPQSDPFLSCAAPCVLTLLHTALIPRYIYAPVSFFTLYRNQMGRDNSTPPKKIWRQHHSKYD